MPNEPKQSEYDIFIARTVYPEAEAVFTARYKPLETIKADCIVVLDTNTLLVPYSIGRESLEQIKTTYRNLIDAQRLVIPAQVAREFAKNRSSKIAEVFEQLSKKRDSSQPIQKGRYPLLESVPAYQQSLALEDEINKSLTTYRETLNKVLAHIREWNWDDPVSLLYAELFGPLVIEAPVADEQTKKDLLRRQVHKIPPAYKDSAKSDAGIGDLLIWQTILEIGTKQKKSVLFVSHDEKSDWWHRSGEQPLYPRYELIDEFRRASDGETFHIVRFSRFLELFGASEPVVSEVKEQEIPIERSEWGKNFGEVAFNSVSAWLIRKFEGYRVEMGLKHEFVVRSEDGSIHTVVDIRIMHNSSNLARRLREMESKVEQYVYFNAKRLLVIVTDDYEKALSLTSRFEQFATSRLVSRFMVTIGFLRNNEEFAELFSTE